MARNEVILRLDEELLRSVRAFAAELAQDETDIIEAALRSHLQLLQQSAEMEDPRNRTLRDAYYRLHRL